MEQAPTYTFEEYFSKDIKRIRARRNLMNFVKERGKESIYDLDTEDHSALHAQMAIYGTDFFLD